MFFRFLWTALGVVCLWNPAICQTQTLRFDLPSQTLETFGRSFSADFLGPTRGTIVAGRAELTYTTDGTLDASQLLISFQAPSQGVPLWQLSGPRLGWVGSGTFAASLTTDLLNGVIDLGEPEPDYSLFLVDIRTVDGLPLSGQFTSSFFEVDIEGGEGGVIPSDVNLDRTLDLADAVGLLAVLFLSNASPPCGDPTVDDAANVALLDANGDHTINLSDVVYVLSNLFLGGAPPILGSGCTAISGCPQVCDVEDTEEVSVEGN